MRSIFAAAALLAAITLVNSAQVATAQVGPVDPETACAQYDPTTGSVVVSTDTIWNWFFTSNGNLTGDPAQGLTQQLTTDNDNTIGEGSFIAAFSYTNLNLGNVAVTGLTANDFVFKYTIGGFSGGEEIEVPMKIGDNSGGDPVIPEPTTLALAGLGLCGVLTTRRRRNA